MHEPAKRWVPLNAGPPSSSAQMAVRLDRVEPLSSFMTKVLLGWGGGGAPPIDSASICSSRQAGRVQACQKLQLAVSVA